MVLSKQPKFWISFTLLSLIAAFLSHKYMNKVYSLVNLEITVDRHQVLEDAQKLAAELKWDLEGYQNVTSFESQDELQCFVELEAGGKEAFVTMFQSGVYYPYRWQVRFFKEKEVVEMLVCFSPEGKRLGFAKKLPEQAAGAALTRAEAQTLVELHAHDWCPNFEKYKLIEYDSEKRDTGRVDHDFNYERTDIAIGKGFYRFNAVVCGDVITKMKPVVKVPDNFVRRYQQMRSANNLLGSVGSFFFRSLYILFFGLIGLVFFYRRNYFYVQSSCVAATVVAGGMLLRGLNEIPLWWASYDTVQPVTTFILMKLFGQLIMFVCLFAMIFITLLVAEAAGRFIYKSHLQFFQIFTLPVAGSLQIAQQVVYGYLMVPFMFAYVVAFGYLTKTYFGWWSPAGSLFDPNIVASYFPWLGALTISLQAGFFEEVVCRALPLAMVAVLTRDSKHKKIWFILIFIVQALIFGACHANYPNQPFYARLIELILPSFGFGLMYLNFGLLPGVITHFVYDVVWFAMPIFVSNLFWSKVMVVVFAGLPLWIVCSIYAYNKKLYDLPTQYFNRAFVGDDVVPTIVQPRRIGEAIPARNTKLIVALGLCGLIAWVTTYKFSPDVDSLQVTKVQAIEIARQALKNEFQVDLDDEWTPVAIAQDDCSSTASRFIWQVYGQEIYNLACGSYLSGINWSIRFVKFSGEVEDRGEEYGVVIASSNLARHESRQPIALHAGHVIKVSHILPEHFVGADILQEQAQAIVHNFIEKKYCLQPQDTSFISVNSEKFDARRDWTIIMQDTQIFDFALEGQARIKVKVSGDKVTEFSRFIFVPEDWTRADQARMMNLNLAKMGLLFLMFVLMGFGCMFAISRLSTSRVGLQMMRHKGLFIAMVSFIYAINNISVFIASFNTVEPFYDQLTRVSLGLITSVSWQVLLCSIFLAIGAVGFVRGIKLNFIQSFFVSLAAALIILGVSSLLSFYEPFLQPVVGNYGPIAHWSPLVAFCAGYLKTFYMILSALIGMFIVLKSLRNLFPDRVWMQLLCCVLFCLSTQAVQVRSSIPWMFLHGIIMGCVIYAVYYLLLKYDMTLLPLVFGGFIICIIFPELISPSYVGASFDALVAMGLVILVSLFFYERAHQE